MAVLTQTTGVPVLPPRRMTSVGTVITKAVSKALAPQFDRLPWAASTPFIVFTELGGSFLGSPPNSYFVQRPRSVPILL